MRYVAYSVYAVYGQGMDMVLDYAKITDARKNIGPMYDSASQHVPARVSRGQDPTVAMVRLDDYLRALAALCPINPQVRFGDDGTVSMWIDDLPVHAEGGSFDAAAAGLVSALQNYALTWAEDLKMYPNHEANWGIANIALLSTDEQLRGHLFGDD
jgi:Antitoxin of toxin-antitoxin, RelE / RelB, TA system